MQHGYEIFGDTGDLVKTGISGRPLNINETSPRANAQVNALGRQSALNWEINNSMRLWDEGNSMILHKRPRPWEW